MNRHDVEARIKEIDEILATIDRTSDAPPGGTLPPEGSTSHEQGSSNRASPPESQVESGPPSGLDSASKTERVSPVQPSAGHERPSQLAPSSPTPSSAGLPSGHVAESTVGGPTNSTANARRTGSSPAVAVAVARDGDNDGGSDKGDQRNNAATGDGGSLRITSGLRARTLAGFLRADIAPTAPGAVFAFGTSLAVSRSIEVAAAATMGPHLGAWLGGTYLLGSPSTRLRPFFEGAIPVFFSDGVQVGAQAGGGIRWQLLSRVAVRVGLGGVFVPTLDHPPKAALLAGLGIQIWR
ncbi:MAG: hypothetical protein V2A73_10355 [Pseudomonadota bacterium]